MRLSGERPRPSRPGLGRRARQGTTGQAEQSNTHTKLCLSSQRAELGAGCRCVLMVCCPCAALARVRPSMNARFLVSLSPMLVLCAFASARWPKVRRTSVV